MMGWTKQQVLPALALGACLVACDDAAVAEVALDAEVADAAFVDGATPDAVPDAAVVDGAIPDAASSFEAYGFLIHCPIDYDCSRSSCQPRRPHVSSPAQPSSRNAWEDEEDGWDEGEDDATVVRALHYLCTLHYPDGLRYFYIEATPVGYNFHNYSAYFETDGAWLSDGQTAWPTTATYVPLHYEWDDHEQVGVSFTLTLADDDRRITYSSYDYYWDWWAGVCITVQTGDTEYLDGCSAELRLPEACIQMRPYCTHGDLDYLDYQYWLPGM